ncbi:universal stress protein UspA [Hydrococcus rivularis NIES-593]|uniref:Universal stress protein UspA n=1 Tax=Hydrococcus rivularis NIES-593 TaxID=1921803 RepID=A0A1U7HER0_9CYAN|nr:universal stress protein [Hydrococcus rivularis]OKH22028.1 universal stress protein UspA [Hydrococcus rivularis NIES-593]
MFNKILVALDCSETSKRAFDKALALAEVTNASLLLLHVLSPTDKEYPAPVDEGMYSSTRRLAWKYYIHKWEEFVQKRFNCLRSLAERANKLGISAEVAQTLGNPGRIICEVARNWQADLIVVGRRGRRGLRELLLGSTSNYVIHHAYCSILMVQGQVEPTVDPCQETTLAAVM